MLLLSFFELFIWTRGLCFHSCPTLSSSPTYEHMRCPRKVSNILRTPVKFPQNPSGKTLQNCFIHKFPPDLQNETNKTHSTALPYLGSQMSKTRSQRTLIGRNKNVFYWLIGERTKLQRRTQDVTSARKTRSPAFSQTSRGQRGKGDHPRTGLKIADVPQLILSPRVFCGPPNGDQRYIMLNICVMSMSDWMKNK